MVKQAPEYRTSLSYRKAILVCAIIAMVVVLALNGTVKDYIQDDGLS